MKIAVLLATYNRKEITLTCIKNLEEQELAADDHLEIFLTDDASEDGTAEAIRTQFPQVHLYEGSGSLFWAGGMRSSWKHAFEHNPDYYLLLNDDTLMVKDTISKLLQYSQEYYKEHSNYAILVGTTKDSDSGLVSYGGRKLYSKGRIQSYLVQDNEEFVEADLGEANIMLVPKEIVLKIGGLSEKYTHFFADHDYGLRAIKEGFKVIVPPGIYGDCTNDHGKEWKSGNTSLAERLKYLYSPKGLAYKEYLYFMRQHFPLQLPAAVVKIWVKTFFPFVYDRFKR